MTCGRLALVSGCLTVLALGCSSAKSGGGSGGGAGGGAGTRGGGQGDGAAGAGGAAAGGGPGGAAADGSAGAGGGGAGGAIGAGGAGGQGGASSAVTSPIGPVRLRTELQAAPLGIQTATPRLGWELETPSAGARGDSQSSYEILVATSLDELAANRGELWASGAVASSEPRAVYAGRALASSARAYWKVRVRDQADQPSAWSAPASFTVGLLAAADWGGARWISGAAGAGSTAPLPIFRREVTLSKPVRRALASVCGLGQFELRINGANASQAVMEPGWTNYAKSCHYVTYDVTAALQQGANAVAVMLGNGMYNVPASSRYAKFTGSFGAPKLILRLGVEHTDGTTTVLVSDTSWKASPGPITFSNVYGGEDFDARREPSGWDRPGFADAAWPAATAAAGTAPALVARAAPSVAVQRSLSSVRVTQPQPGIFVYDLGQNFSGWPALAAQGPAGTTVKMTPGELLTAAGLVTQANIGSPVSFSYTLAGTGRPEAWEPRFTYTGFRYVQVEGGVPVAMAAAFPGRPQITDVVGKFVYSTAESVGSFTSSDADLNRVHALILQAIRSNLQSLVTDCPHREKLGWLETTHLLAASIMFNHDVAGLYEKIIDDMRDAQTASGLVPDIAPEYTVFPGNFRDSPEWGSAYVLNPWQVYQMYGDRKPLDDHYANMKRYVSYLGGKATQNVLGYGLGDWYDVGPAAPGASQLTGAGLTATAIWLQDLQVLRAAAQLLGASADAAGFATTEASVTAAFNARFLGAGGFYDRDSQTANAMPLALGLVPAAQKASALSHLVNAVTAAQSRVTAGDIGFLYLIRALAQAGRHDVVHALVKQSAGPGYLYQLARGATALTEAWDANPSSSHNHAMLGHAEEWLYTGLAGINPDPAGPGFAKILVRPQPQPGLDSVSAQYRSARGLVASGWARGAGGGITYTITIPVNATATITIPTANPAGVTESGGPAATARGVTTHAEQAAALVLGVGSGRYVFAAP